MTRPLCQAVKPDRITGELRPCRLHVAPHSESFCAHHEKDALRRLAARAYRAGGARRNFFVRIA